MVNGLTWITRAILQLFTVNFVSLLDSICTKVHTVQKRQQKTINHNKHVGFSEHINSAYYCIESSVRLSRYAYDRKR